MSLDARGRGVARLHFGWMTGCVLGALMALGAPCNSGAQQSSEGAKPSEPVRVAHPEDWTIYITNDACSDYTWGWDEEQTRKAYADVIASHLDEMNLTDKEKPENRDHYNLSITQEGLVFLERYPDRKEEFLRRVHEGRISVGAFLNNNLWGFQSVESELRDLYPARRMEEQWGISIRTAQHIEEPALPWGAATILSASGFKWLIIPFLDYDSTFSKLENPPFFVWKGADGSQIRVLMDKWASETLAYEQGGRLLKKPELIEDQWLPHYQQAGQAYPLRVILASGTHNDNGPASSKLTPGFAQGIIDYNARPGQHAKLINGTLPEFVAEVDKVEDQLHFMPTLSGDFGQSWDVWPVTLADVAMRMRTGERSFLAAEALLAVAARANPSIAETTRETHRSAEWNLAMLADHAWNGASDANRKVNADLRQHWGESLIKLDDELQQQGWTAAGLVPGTTAVTLFNSLSVERADLVSLTVPAGVGAVRGHDSQIVEDQGQRTLYFVSPKMPGFAFSTLKLAAKSSPDSGRGKLRAASLELESPFYRLRIDPQTGGIASLIQKSTNTELRVPGDRTIGQSVFFDGKEHPLTDVHTEVVAQGPVLARLKVSGTTEGIAVTTLVTVYAELDRVDLDIAIHKPVTLQEQRLTQFFPVARDGAVERMETTGAVERPYLQPVGDLLPGANPKQFAVQNFVDVSSPDGGGVTIAPIDAFVLRQDLGPVTFEAIGNDQNYKEATHDQHAATDFRLRYSLRAHRSGYDGAEAFPWSRAVATPLLARLGTVPAATLAQPSVKVDSARAIATTLKTADGAGNLLRLWEVAGKEGPLAIAVPGYSRAVHTDLLERDLEPLAIENGKIEIPLAANGFAAVRLIP
jgi:hypothetical protein